jgi:hypothetical protein
MKRLNAAHLVYLLLVIWLIALSALTLTACGQNDTATEITDTTDATPSAAPISFDADAHIPEIRVNFAVEDIGSRYSAELTRGGTYTWTLPAGNGMMQTVHADGCSPDQMEGLCTIAVQCEDARVTLDLPDDVSSYQVFRRMVRDYTHPPLRELETASNDGILTLKEGRWYYEIRVKYPEGEATYGFEAYYSAEFTEQTRQIGSFLETVSREDPDYGLRKYLTQLPVFYKDSQDRLCESYLRPAVYCGWEWVNHAGTLIRTEQSFEEYAASTLAPTTKVFEYDPDRPPALVIRLTDAKSMTVSCTDSDADIDAITLPTLTDGDLIIRDGKTHSFRVAAEFADGSIAEYFFTVTPKSALTDEGAAQ